MLHVTLGFILGVLFELPVFFSVVFGYVLSDCFVCLQDAVAFLL